MSKRAKIWLIIATSLILIGCILFGGAMAMHGWDLTKLSMNKYETNNHEINENYKNISITAHTADIVFVPSESSKCFVECYEQENVKHSVAVKDDTLVIEVVDTRKWYEYIGINFETSRITVYLPQGEYDALSVASITGDVELPKNFKFSSIDISAETGNITSYASSSGETKIKTTTGNIHIEGISASVLDLSVCTGKVTASDIICDRDVRVRVSTGRAYLTDIACKNVISSGDTGDISLKNVVATKKFSIERITGHVRFDGCDAAEIFVETATGNVTGTLLSEKVFIVNTDTGKKEVPDTITGGRCEITTGTGDIKIDIKQ